MGTDTQDKQREERDQADESTGRFADWMRRGGETDGRQAGPTSQAPVPKNDGPRKVPNANTGRPKGGAVKPLNQGGARAPKSVGGRTSTSAGAIKAPPRVQLGDLELGKHETVEVPVFNLTDVDDATIFSEVDGAPDVRVVSEPFAIWPREAGKSIKLEFRPTVVGRVAGNLRIRASWRSEQPASEITVSIIGGAHVGDQTLDEQDAARAAETKKTQDAATAQRDQERVDKQIEEAGERDKPYHAGHLNQLANARERARVQLELLFNLRQNAIGQADSVIGKFERMIPPEHHSMLLDLAYLALDVASAGIAGGVAKRLEPALAGILATSGSPGGQIHYPTSPDAPMATNSRSVGEVAATEAGKAVVSIFADGIKQLVKSGAAELKGAIKGKSEGPTEQEMHGGVSVEAKSAFLRTQRDTLAYSNADRATTISIRAYNALLLGLDSAPQAMIATMKAVADSLGAVASAAGDIQLRETVTQWVSLVAKTAAQMPQGATRTANIAPRLDEPLPPRDGLIDISFTGDEFDASAPIQIKNARVNGITPDALQVLIGNYSLANLPPRSIREIGLAIRVSGMLSGNDSSVTVVRDEAGNLEYTDRSGLHWFARRVGVMTRATDADQRRGAKQFLDREILDRTLANLNTTTDAKK